MRFLHTSDLHLGKQLNEMPLLEDQRHILGQIVDIAKSREVDAVVVAGDVYDKSSPSAEAVSLLDGFLTSLSKRKIPGIFVSGNHDSAERIAYARTLMAQNGIHVSPVFVGTLERVDLQDEHGTVSFWLMPFVKPAHVRPHFPQNDIGSDYTAAVSAVIANAEIDRASRNVLVGHQFVTSGSTAPDRTDSELSLGGLDNVDISAYEPFDYVALGHVHRAQQIGRPTARYAGSPLKYSLSEAVGEKSVTLVEMGKKGSVSFEKIALKPLRDVRKLRGPLQGIAKAAQEEPSGRDDYVHVTLTDERPPLNAMSRIRDIYPNAIGLAYDNARTNAQGISAEDLPDLSTTTPEELFAEFYETQNGAPMSESQAAIVRSALEEIGGQR